MCLIFGVRRIVPDVMLTQETCHVEFGVSLAVCVLGDSIKSIYMFQWVLKTACSLFINAGCGRVESGPVSCDV